MSGMFWVIVVMENCIDVLEVSRVEKDGGSGTEEDR